MATLASTIGVLRDRLQGAILTTVVGVLIASVATPTFELFAVLCRDRTVATVTKAQYEYCVGNLTLEPMDGRFATNALLNSTRFVGPGQEESVHTILGILYALVVLVPLVDLYLHMRATWDHGAAFVCCGSVTFCTHDCGTCCYCPLGCKEDWKRKCSAR